MYKVILQAGELYRDGNGAVHTANDITKYADVKTLREASQLVRDYIKYYGLGSSTFTGGDVLNQENKVVYRVSYNGRVWDTHGNLIKV